MRDEILRHEQSNECIKYDDYIAGLAKGLAILNAFGTERQRLNVTQAAERTNMSRTAARRHLRTLKYLGYLDSDDYYFWLTHKVLKFSGAYFNTAHLPKIAQPILNLLAQQSPLIYSVAVFDHHGVVPVARAIAHQADNFRVNPFGIHLGNRIPVHASSTGKIFLSYKSLDEQKSWLKDYELKRFTHYTILDSAHFLETLQQVREAAYCISCEEYELGVTAIAVPVVNQQGDLIAALNAVASVNKVSDAYLTHSILPKLREAAKEIRDMI